MQAITGIDAATMPEPARPQTTKVGFHKQETRAVTVRQTIEGLHEKLGGGLLAEERMSASGMWNLLGWTSF